MPRKASRPASIDGEERQWHDPHRQEHVRDQNREVHDADSALTLERDGAHLGVMQQVRHQKHARETEGEQHAGLVGFRVPAADEDVAGDQEQPSAAVEHGVDGGQHAGVAHFRTPRKRVQDHRHSDGNEDGKARDHPAGRWRLGAGCSGRLLGEGRHRPIGSAKSRNR